MIPSITSQLSQNRLCWFGHVKRSDGTINSILSYKAPGKRAPGRPKKTWSQTVTKDISDWNMPTSAENRYEWRSTMWKNMQSCNPHFIVENKLVK